MSYRRGEFIRETRPLSLPSLYDEIEYETGVTRQTKNSIRSFNLFTDDNGYFDEDEKLISGLSIAEGGEPPR